MIVEEYNQAVDLYSDAIFRFILKNCRDDDKAKDIVQDSYEKLWKNHKDVNFSKVKSYLFSTAYHTLIDSIRRDKKRGSWDEVNERSLSYSNSYSDLSELLNRALDQLPEKQKMVILMRDYEGYAYNEIGEITGLSVAQVKVYIFRARKFLKAYIGKVEVLV